VDQPIAMKFGMLIDDARTHCEPLKHMKIDVFKNKMRTAAI